MKKRIIAALLLVAAFSLAAGGAFAANSLQQGAMGVSVGMGDSVFANKTIPMTNAVVNDVVNINGLYFIGKNLAIQGGVGLQMDTGDADATYFSISGGVRKYLKTDDFAPFVGGQLTIASVSAKKNSVKTADLTVLDLAGTAGAEYFLSKQFSLEGAVGVGLGQAKDKVNSITDTYFGTRTVGVKANFYF